MPPKLGHCLQDSSQKNSIGIRWEYSIALAKTITEIWNEESQDFISDK